ncbi:MAG: ATP-dependent nuclease [Terriglobia bacterium]
MKIESITIRGFRCFDESGQTIWLDDLACFVGPNASGKTAAMMALGRLFGETNTQRQVVSADFHLAPGEDLRAKSPRSLIVECRLAFPEIENGDGATNAAVPETFNQMTVDEPGGTPYCRLRLEAIWTNDDTPDGDIEQSLWWICTNSDDPAVIGKNRHKVLPGIRAKIRVVYVPAAREPEQQIRATTATSFGRLLGYLSWNGADESLKKILTMLQGQLAELTGIKTINSEVQTAWQGFYPGRVAREVAFQALEEDPDALVKLLVPSFRPGEDGRTMFASELSDGLRSLFSISLSLGLFRTEELLRENPASKGFKAEITEKLPILTVFAVEEPENHLSPHYLGRVMTELTAITKNSRAQVILSSHSPSILGRVKPDDVRYFLGNEQTPATKVKPIPLPTDENDEAFKYVREAVRGFPEIYFAHLVILGEGASEEIVLRRLFEASGTPLDTYFISVAPLGGKHVNHFWRLLHGLDIPFLTLLDLDREKEGAGWGRVQYVRDQLVQRFGAGHEKLRCKTRNDEPVSLEDVIYENLSTHSDTDTAGMDAWLTFFKNRFGVFFSTPLDLDLAMLEAFPDVYKELAPTNGGPRLPRRGTLDYQEAVQQRMKQVLAADASKASPDLGSTYTQDQQELFAWYKYLFVDRSKPVAHMRALLKIAPDKFAANAPEMLKELVVKARELVAFDDGVV